MQRFALLLSGFALFFTPSVVFGNGPDFEAELVSVWNSASNRFPCLDDMLKKINHPKNCGMYGNSKVFSKPKDREVLENALQHCQQFYQALYESVHLSCQFQDAADTRLRKETEAKAKGATNGQAGSIGNHASVVQSSLDFSGEWKDRFYSQKFSLDGKAKAYFHSLQSLTDKAKKILAAEATTQFCGVSGVSPSLIFFGFVGGQAITAAENYKEGVNFLSDLYYRTSHSMNEGTRQKLTDGRNRVVQGVAEAQDPGAAAEVKGAKPKTAKILQGAGQDYALVTATEKLTPPLVKVISKTAASVVNVGLGPAGVLAADGALRLVHGDWDALSTAMFGSRVIIYGLGIGIVVASGPASPITGSGMGWTITAVEVTFSSLEAFIRYWKDRKEVMAGEELVPLLRANPGLDSASLSRLYHEQVKKHRCSSAAAQGQ